MPTVYSHWQEAHTRAEHVEQESSLRLQTEVERSEVKLRRELEFIRRGTEAAAAERDRALVQARQDRKGDMAVDHVTH